jgi:hypothetical protein
MGEFICDYTGQESCLYFLEGAIFYLVRHSESGHFCFEILKLGPE